MRIIVIASCWMGLVLCQFASAQDSEFNPDPFGVPAGELPAGNAPAESLPLPPPTQPEPPAAAASDSMGAEKVLMTQRLALLQERYDEQLNDFGRRHPSLLELEREMTEIRRRLRSANLAPTRTTQKRIDERILEFDDRQLRRAVGLLIGRVLELETQVQELTQANTLLRQRITKR